MINNLIMLPKLLDKIKSSQYHIFLAICIALISLISFNMGKIASQSKGSIKTLDGADIYKAMSADENLTARNQGVVVNPTATPKPLDMRVVVSKASDSKKNDYTTLHDTIDYVFTIEYTYRHMRGNISIPSFNNSLVS